ncbi:hypothetical protein [Peptoniphilus sp. HMSC062D09]|uniref:hypothetical protein n=1 Tax=Peptoniphilus sp. HMSC062D09 TaxID=1739305 RepID=UPI0008A44142|nr:hypothetical protein [Peptoniphilus sp. HMSC062D09]OFK84950.1 hypothetical protein HMPREF2801_02180 [Peptoniphilus sp. HMSC062D09]
MKNKLNYKGIIFQDNVFSEKGLNKYIKHITKENEIRKDMISILSEENCNENNLNLIKLSEKKSEAKHKYDGLNGFLFSMILFIGGYVLDIFLKDSSEVSKLICLILAEIILLRIGVINLKNSLKKPEEKRAETYFWLETEMEKRIKESKDSEDSKNSKGSKEQITTI